MAGPVFVIKSESLFSFQVPEDAVADIQKLGDLTDEQIQNLIDALGKVEGFLGMNGLESVVIKEIGKGEIAEAVIRVLWHVEADELPRFLHRLEEETKDKEQFRALKACLTKLVRICPALERYRKAQRLVGATGQRLEEVQIICDLRPIFDVTREKIEGLFPTSILRVVAEGANGLSRVTEVNLSVSQVYELSEKADIAKKKLESLKLYVQGRKPETLPDLPSTRLPKEAKR